MSIARVLGFGSIFLFGVIGLVYYLKKPAVAPSIQTKAVVATPAVASPKMGEDGFPVADRIQQLFTIGPMKLPIVETVVFTSSVPWLKGRPAWIADYASYYNTSRHFIARSLNAKADYTSQNVSNGSKFNVLRKEKKIQFHLLVDLARCKMAFYYIDLDTKERVHLKSYLVGLGRKDAKSPSGSLTPLGRYVLGSKVAIYKPGDISLFQKKEIEMIRVFGTRWIPFDKELEGATAAAKGLGIHGVPWIALQQGKLGPHTGGVGCYDSDGCVRMLQEDMEELFSLVISRPTIIEIVKDFREAKLPGVERGVER